MKKVMLVEDEDFILQGIKYIIDWEALSMEIAATAHNGKEALEIFQENPTDIVVTDVEMPRMNGLELLREIRKLNSRTRGIILSGYDEFEYARTALRLDVEEYILKPINEDQLRDALIRAGKHLDELDRKKAGNMEDKIGWIRFLKGKLAREEEAKFYQMLPEIEEGEKVYAAIMKIDTDTIENTGGMMNILAELQKLGQKLKPIYLAPDTLFLLMYMPQEAQDQEILDCYGDVQDHLESSFGIMSFFTVSNAITEYEQLPTCYKTAQKLQKYKMLEGYGSCINEAHIQDRKSQDVVIDETMLRKMILKKDKEGALNYIEGLFINNLESEVNVEVLYQMSLKIAMLLQDIKMEYKLAQSTNLRDLSEIIEKIYQADDLLGLKAIFISEIVEIINYLHTEDSQYTPVVKQIMAEVQKNYKEDMNLKTLSYKYHMNASYLGQIFQKEAGCSFAQYLSNTKNGIAKDLILNTNMKINDIAKEVGYPDTSYFYRKFKQCYGVITRFPADNEKILSRSKEEFRMKWRHRKKAAAMGMITCLAAGILSGCKEQAEINENGEEVVWLTWYQVGDEQKDDQMVLDAVNDYTFEKIGVKIKIEKIGWSDYSQKMQIMINTNDSWDLCFTSSWTNDYLQNAQKGVYLELDEYLEDEGLEMYEAIDSRFWEAARVGGKIYGIPSEKEIGSCPMWVFTKEYVDKYDIPYEEIHNLEDLEPWLKLIQEKEPDVVPMYLTKDYSAPAYMDKIVDPIGIEYADNTLTVQNLFETEKMMSTLRTMRKYYEAGYINQDAPLASDDKAVKRFVTKGDGHPFAEISWGKDLGYEVVASPIMETQITNESARGALTAINKNSKHPKEAVEFLNLVNTDEYLRNLLNYGIEGVHWSRIPVEEKEAGEAEGKPYVYDTKVRLNQEKKQDYSVPYWVQGGLFGTYVLENEPVDKWAVFKEFNDASKAAPSLGFDFNIEQVKAEVADFRSILDEFGKALYTGSVDPDVYVSKLLKKLDAAGVDRVIEEMQRQVDAWKQTKE